MAQTAKVILLERRIFAWPSIQQGENYKAQSAKLLNEVINGNFHPAEAGDTGLECANAALREWQEKVKT